MTLCDPVDCSTPGLPVHHHPKELAQSHVHRISDAIQPSRPVAPFSSRLQSFRASGSLASEVTGVGPNVRLLETPWTTAPQAPPSMGFPRQEDWSGLPFPSPGDLPHPGIKPTSLASPAPGRGADSSLLVPPEKKSRPPLCCQKTETLQKLSRS